MPVADLLGLQQNGPDTTGMSFELDTAQDRANALQAHNQNVKMSLLAAGLATLAAAHEGRRRGERESVGAEIGRGGLLGLENYENQEATIAKQQLAQQQLRGLQAYRQADLNIKGRGEQSLEQYRTGIVTDRGNEDIEHHRHNVQAEETAKEGKDIAQQNADTNRFRLGLEDTRNKIAQEAADTNRAKLMSEVAPGAIDTLKGFRGTAVEKAIPGMPDERAVMTMPPKYAYALQKDIINTYARMKTDKTYAPHWSRMSDNHLHKFWTDSTGDHDQDMGPMAVTGYPDETAPTDTPAATDTPTATATPTPSNMPPPATPTATATRTATATPTGTPAGAPAMTGVPKQYWGMQIRSKKDGKLYNVDNAGNATLVQ